MYSAGLNKFGPHKLMCLNVWSMGSGIIKMCGFVGGGVALLEEVWPCWRRCGLVGKCVLLESEL